MAEVEKLIAQIDVESTPAQNEIRVFPLANALATELAPVLQTAITEHPVVQELKAPVVEAVKRLVVLRQPLAILR